MRRLATTLLGAALLLSLAAIASAQVWKYPPGPPYRACGDTLKIFDVQRFDTLAAPCHPATLDTVLGVRGIITAFDTRSPGFGFYIQNYFIDGGHAWTGMDIFTGAYNYASDVPDSPSGGFLQAGDSVVVYGTTQEFPAVNGESEIEGPDVIQATNDILIRKINSGNPLPAAHVGTTHDFNWIPATSAATAEPWEGCLVRLNGPLHVARIPQGNGQLGVDAQDFLIVSPSAPSDSVLIDGFTLGSFGTPAVDDPITYVQGILNQRDSGGASGAVNSYRIQLRKGSDIGIASSPSLVDAYPIQDNQLRIVFDQIPDPIRGLDAGNYHLASEIDGSTVNTVAYDVADSAAMILGIFTLKPHGYFETISVELVGSKSCPACTTGTSSRDFANGVLSCAEVQAPDPGYLAIYQDRSRFAGDGESPGIRVSVRSTSVTDISTLEMLGDSGGGYRSGLAAYATPSSLTNGKKYLLAGAIQEFSDITEMIGFTYLKDEGASSIAAPAVQTINVLSDTTTDKSGGAVPGAKITGEDYEGVLVRVNHVSVCAFYNPPRDPAAGGSFLVTNLPRASVGSPAPDTILVSLGGTPPFAFNADTLQVVNVTGILNSRNGLFRIEPRNDADIQLVTAGVGDHDLAGGISLAVSPNPGIAQRVDFVVPHRDQVELAVFDLQGRQLRILAKGLMPAGSYSQKWDGTDGGGKLVGAGMYFYRLRVGGEESIVRAVTLH